MEYLVCTVLVTDSNVAINELAQKGWQVHSMELTGSAKEEGTDVELPLFTFLLHRMLPQPQEQEKPKAMAMKG